MKHNYRHNVSKHNCCRECMHLQIGNWGSEKPSLFCPIQEDVVAMWRECDKFKAIAKPEEPTRQFHAFKSTKDGVWLDGKPIKIRGYTLDEHVNELSIVTVELFVDRVEIDK